VSEQPNALFGRSGTRRKVSGSGSPPADVELLNRRPKNLPKYSSRESCDVMRGKDLSNPGNLGTFAFETVRELAIAASGDLSAE
jgi:hypothetical protein